MGDTCMVIMGNGSSFCGWGKPYPVHGDGSDAWAKIDADGASTAALREAEARGYGGQNPRRGNPRSAEAEMGEVMILDRLRDRYQNDAAFHTLVDVLQGAILNMQLTPSEVREAAMLACCMIDERYPKPLMFAECIEYGAVKTKGEAK